jgi:hypothetical protein
MEHPPQESKPPLRGIAGDVSAVGVVISALVRWWRRAGMGDIWSIRVLNHTRWVVITEVLER